MKRQKKAISNTPQFSSLFKTRKGCPWSGILMHKSRKVSRKNIQNNHKSIGHQKKPTNLSWWFCACVTEK